MSWALSLSLKSFGYTTASVVVVASSYVTALPCKTHLPLIVILAVCLSSYTELKRAFYYPVRSCCRLYNSGNGLG